MYKYTRRSSAGCSYIAYIYTRICIDYNRWYTAQSYRVHACISSECIGSIYDSKREKMEEMQGSNKPKSLRQQPSAWSLNDGELAVKSG